MDYVTRQFINLAKKLRKDFNRLLPSLQRSIEKISTKIESTSAKNQSREQQPATLPPVIFGELRRPQAEIDQEETRYSHNEERETRKEGRDRTRIVFEAGGLLVATILAGANIGLWLVTKEVSNATRDAAAAANAQVQATRTSIEATVNAFQSDQRAWVYISDVIPPVMDTKTAWNAVLDIKNTGKTPATNVQLQVLGEFEKKGEKPRLPEKLLLVKGLIPPNGLFHATLGDQVKPIDSAGASALMSGDLVFWVHGKITYDDVFKKPHSVKFCYYFIPQERTIEHGVGGFGLCDSGNAIDD